VKQTQGLQLEVLPHPPYSPDLAPSEFHLFWTREDSVRKRRFRSYEEVKEAVRYWLVHQPKDVLCRGICALVELWRRCVERGRG
jgi:transposase